MDQALPSQRAVRALSRQSRCARRACGHLRAADGDGPPGAGEPQPPRQESDLRLPLAGSDTDWRAFRARLVAGEGPAEDAAAEAPAGNEPSTSGRQEDGELWAHPIAQPEQGCLLLSHPLMFQSSQQYFNQAVILVISHDAQGTAGILLNKPLEHLIGQLSGAEALLPEFGPNRLFLGGDVGGADGHNVMQLLHGHGAALEGSKEVVPGVFLGGFQASKLAVRQGRLPASDFRWHCRYCGWAPGQLAAECEKGVWFLAAASPGLVLHPSCEQGLGRRHWHEVLQAMGGEYRQLSEALLVDPATRREVWGRSEFLRSSQQPEGGVPGPEGGEGQ